MDLDLERSTHRAIICLFDIDLKKVNPPVDWDVDQVLNKMTECLLEELLLQRSQELPLPNNDRQITLSPNASEDNCVVPGVVVTLRAYNALQLICITLECTGRLRMRNVAPGELVTLNEDVIEMIQNRLSSCYQPALQNIKILHSRTFGNTLLLDGTLNMAESDIVYTYTLMNRDEAGISYTDKEILILGGGDGGLLNALLKEKPKFVTMIEIDQQVIDCCRTYMRGVCGDSLDTLKSERHEIIIDDCMAQMQLFIDQGRKFNFIFNDLTDIPLMNLNAKSDFKKCQLWTFITQVLNESLQCLCSNGIYMNHATGVNCDRALRQYENVLDELKIKVKYKRRQAWVPSFLENWVFYQIQLNQAEIDN